MRPIASCPMYCFLQHGERDTRKNKPDGRSAVQGRCKQVNGKTAEIHHFKCAASPWSHLPQREVCLSTGKEVDN